MKWFALLLIACTLPGGTTFPAGAATPEQPTAGLSRRADSSFVAERREITKK